MEAGKRTNHTAESGHVTFIYTEKTKSTVPLGRGGNTNPSTLTVVMSVKTVQQKPQTVITDTDTCCLNNLFIVIKYCERSFWDFSSCKHILKTSTFNPIVLPAVF